MQIGAIVPHLGIYGGVRYFLEIGNICVGRGIDYTIFSNREQECSWFDFKGKIKDWSNIEADYILVGDPPSFKVLPTVKGKVFIYVMEFINPLIFNNEIKHERIGKATL